MSKKQNKKSVKQVAKPTNTKWYGLLIALLAFLIYANTLSHDYCLDDISAITENRFVKQGSYKKLLTTHYRAGYWASKGTLYRPLTLVMFAQEWHLSQDNPAISHFVNILFFALTGWLLFQFLAMLLDKRFTWLPLIISLIFVAHPIHTEVVANIKSRDEIMAFFFGLAGLYYFVKYFDTKKILFLIYSLLVFTLALFSKESAITWILIYPLTLLFFRKESIKRIAGFSAIYIIPTIAFLMIRSNILGKMASVKPDIVDNFFTSKEGISTANYYGSALYMAFEYLKALVLPFNLVSDKGFNQIPLQDFINIGSILTIALLLGSIYYLFRAFRKKEALQKIIAFGILFLGISFSIYSNLIVEIGSSYGERFLYMPSLGFAFIVGGGVYWLAQKVNKDQVLKIKNPVFLILFAIIGLFSILTTQRNKAWFDSSTLYATDVVKSPNSAKLNYHHGLEVGKKAAKLKGQAQINQYKKALKYFEKAIKIQPNYSDAHGQKGLYYFKLKDNEKALKAYLQATELKPNANAYSNMGIIYFQKKDVQNAEKVYKLAIKYEPAFVDAHRNLGVVYATTNRIQQAIPEFETALKYAPNDPTLLKYLGTAYKSIGDIEKSQSYLNRLK